MEKLKFSEFSPMRLENLESLLEDAFKFFTDVHLGLDDKDLAERGVDAEPLKSDTYVNYLYETKEKEMRNIDFLVDCGYIDETGITKEGIVVLMKLRNPSMSCNEKWIVLADTNKN